MTTTAELAAVAHAEALEALRADHDREVEALKAEHAAAAARTVYEAETSNVGHADDMEALRLDHAKEVSKSNPLAERVEEEDGGGGVDRPCQGVHKLPYSEDGMKKYAK